MFERNAGLVRLSLPKFVVQHFYFMATYKFKKINKLSECDCNFCRETFSIFENFYPEEEIKEVYLIETSTGIIEPEKITVEDKNQKPFYRKFEKKRGNKNGR